jgi:hypothetical protein
MTDTDPNPQAFAPPQPTDPDGAQARVRQQTAPGMGGVAGGPPVAGQAPVQAPREGDVTPVLPRGPEGVPMGQAAPPAPIRGVVLEGTPVPPEATDALLSGLLNGENESYFHKTKPAAASSGEAAVAYAAGPHPLMPASPTPPPQPAVLLRQSVEMDAVNIAALMAQRQGQGAARAQAPDQTPPPGDADVERRRLPTEVMAPLVVPMKGRWVDRWLAFGLTAAVVALAAVAVVRWLAPAGAGAATGEGSEAAKGRTGPVAVPQPHSDSIAVTAVGTGRVAPPPVVAAASVALVAPPPPVPVPEATAEGTKGQDVEGVVTGRPSPEARVPALPVRSPAGTGPAPSDSAPPAPKGDMKRAL